MKKGVYFIITIVGGSILGGIVNGTLIHISGKIIPPPLGVNTQTIEGLKAGLQLFEPKHFLMPFLAHAIGTLVGAFCASLLAPFHKLKASLIVGALYLLGGISMVFQLPSPLWFTIVDLGLAYIPMAILGYKFAKKIIENRA